MLRPAALVWFLCVAAASWVGVFERVDDAAWRATYAAVPTVGRDDTPTVLAIDDASVARWGAPPWDLATWAEISEALEARGVAGVVLADPWPRLLRDVRPERPAGARLVVPSATWDGRATPPLPDARPSWLAPTEDDLRVGVGRGRRGASGAATWWPIQGDDGPTPSAGARIPPARVEVPALSLAALVASTETRLVPGAAGVLLGVTAVPFAESVSLDGGPSQPWVIATAEAMGLARALGTREVPSGVASLLWLLAVHAIGAWAALGRRGAPVAAGFAVLVGIGLVEVLVGVRLSTTASMLAVAAAPTVEALRVASASRVAVQRLGLLVVRAASRAGVLRRRVTTVEGLQEAVADLARGHLADMPHALLLVLPGDDHATVVGGHALPATRFAAPRFALKDPRLAGAVQSLGGVEVDGLLRDAGREVRLVPLHQGRTLLGFWVLSPAPGATPVEPMRVARLVRWLGERLALPGLPGAWSPGDDDVLPAAEDDDALDLLFQAADEERRRWERCLHAVGAPLLVTDAAGVVTTVNPRMAEALEAVGLPRVRSARELLFRVAGEDGLDRRMHALIVRAEALQVPWLDDVHQLVVRPVAVAQDDEAAELLGFVAWLDAPTGDAPVADDDATARFRALGHGT